jgi:antirestriction protein ArdC
MNRSLESIHRQLQSAVERLVDTDEWRAMLEVAARFHTYSTNNQLLIYLQCPHATRVCGYRAWQRLGRQVRKGERGIQILAPCRRVRAIESENSDEPEPVQVLTGFRVVHVFDLSQTDGEELPDVVPRRLSGDVPQDLVDALERRIAAEAFMLRRESITRPSCNGYADFGQREIVLQEGLSGVQSTKTMIHELAHVLLHQESKMSARAVAEVEAESVAFVVCRALGLDTSDYSFAYVARWGGGDTEVIAATAQSVISTAKDILATFEGCD